MASASTLRSLVSRVWDSVKVQLPPLNFITIHYAYFICMCLVASLVFWGSSTPSKSVSYIDSLFLVVSAMVRHVKLLSIWVVESDA